MLSPSYYYGWRGFSSGNLLTETLPRIAEQRGRWEKQLQLCAFPIQESGGKCIWDFKPEIWNLSFPENADNIIFATCILHSYLRDQDIGLSDKGISANDQNILTKIPKQAGNAHWNAVELTDKFKEILIVRMDLCLGRMKDCNVRLI